MLTEEQREQLSFLIADFARYYHEAMLEQMQSQEKSREFCDLYDDANIKLNNYLNVLEGK